MNVERIKELEGKIAEMKSRIPPHSIPPRMLEDIEELEEELERLTKSRDVQEKSRNGCTGET